MSDVISKAIWDTVASYLPEYSKIQAPVLSFFALRDGYDYLSSEYMTEKQKAEVIDFFQTVLQPNREQYLEQFQRKVPHAKIVAIPHGHHYCFMKHAELVFHEMKTFLLEAGGRSIAGKASDASPLHANGRARAVKWNLHHGLRRACRWRGMGVVLDSKCLSPIFGNINRSF